MCWICRETEDTFDRVEAWANTGYVDCRIPKTNNYSSSSGGSGGGGGGTHVTSVPSVGVTGLPLQGVARARSCSQSGASQSNTDSGGTSASNDDPQMELLELGGKVTALGFLPNSIVNTSTGIIPNNSHTAATCVES